MTTAQNPAGPAHADCPACGQRFRLYRPWQKYCSARCRERLKARAMRAAARLYRQQPADRRQP